jgi:hypothetical protein
VRRLARRVHADDDRQLLVGDQDPVAGIFRYVPVGGHDHDDRLADMVHHAVGQRVAGARRVQLRVGDQHRERLGHRAVQVLVRVDRHQALDVQGALGVDAGDPRVRVR